MKALEKDRNRRYDAASSFAADVERYLHDEPVEACPPSAVYRFRKFARRNKVALTTATVIACAVLLAMAGLTASTVLVSRANQELRQNLYYQHIALAEREWSANNLGRMEQLLDACPADLRGWEWHYLKRLRLGGLQPLRDPSVAPSAVISAAFSPDDRWIASGNDNGMVTIWNARSGQKLLAFAAHERHARCVAFSPDGRHLATASWDGTARVWNFNPQRVGSEISLHHTLTGDERRVHSVAFSPNSERLASASQALDGKDNTVRVWDVASGKQIDALRGHAAFLWCVAYSPDGQYLASGSYDQTVRIWDAKTGHEKHCLPHSATVFGVSFSQDGRYLASSSGDMEAWSDGEINVWDVRTGRAVRTLRGHTNRIVSTAFSPDGQRLGSAGMDGTVKVWDLQTGREILTLRGHQGTVQSVAFSRDGNRLLTAGDDRTVRVWDGTPLEAEASQGVTLPGHNGGVSCVAFNPNGLQFASRGYDGTVRIWEIERGLAWVANAPIKTWSAGKVLRPDVVFSNDGHFLALRGDHKLTV